MFSDGQTHSKRDKDYYHPKTNPTTIYTYILKLGNFKNYAKKNLALASS